MSTYIPQRGDFAILTLQQIGRGTYNVNALYATDRETGLRWLTEDGQSFTHGHQAIQNVRRIRVSAPAASAVSPVNEVIKMISDLASTKKAPAKSGGMWSVVVDQVISTLADVLDEPAAKKFEEPTKPGSVVVDRLGNEWMRTFTGRWQNKGGLLRNWDHIQDTIASVKD